MNRGSSNRTGVRAWLTALLLLAQLALAVGDVPALEILHPGEQRENLFLDEITMTFAQPGVACGAPYTRLTCDEVSRAAACDGLISLDSGFSACPTGMHQVYLVVWPSTDYHWYKQDLRGLSLIAWKGVEDFKKFIDRSLSLRII